MTLCSEKLGVQLKNLFFKDGMPVLDYFKLEPDTLYIYVSPTPVFVGRDKRIAELAFLKQLANFMRKIIPVYNKTDWQKELKTLQESKIKAIGRQHKTQIEASENKIYSKIPLVELNEVKKGIKAAETVSKNEL